MTSLSVPHQRYLPALEGPGRAVVEAFGNVSPWFPRILSKSSHDDGHDLLQQCHAGYNLCFELRQEKAHHSVPKRVLLATWETRMQMRGFEVLNSYSNVLCPIRFWNLVGGTELIQLEICDYE